MVAPARPPPNSRVVVGALEDTLDEAITADTKAVVHLACVASGGSEQDFDLGYRVNIDGLVEALERCRSACAAPPKFVFTSSLAVFGARAHADDASSTEPQNSYRGRRRNLHLGEKPVCTDSCSVGRRVSPSFPTLE